MAFNGISATQGITFNHGLHFKKPSLKTLRKHRNQHPKLLFAPTEITSLGDSTGPQFQAMVLLVVNCGFGNTDCSTLTAERLVLAAVKSIVGPMSGPMSGAYRQLVPDVRLKADCHWLQRAE